MREDGHRPPSRRAVLRLIGTAGLTSGTAGCRSRWESGSEPETALELVHDWNGGPRRTAMEALIAAFERARPETPLDRRPVADIEVPELAERRMENGNPPGAFAMALGGALERFGERVRIIGDTVWDEELRAAHVDPAREASRVAGSFAGVPLGTPG